MNISGTQTDRRSTVPGARALFGIFAMLLCAGSMAHPATERFVPIGYWASIGVYNTYTGSLTAVSASGDSLNFVENGKEKTVRITTRTRIWIDRSHMKKASTAGKRTDLREGVTAEIRMSDTDSGAAQWIKIRGDR